MFLVKFVVVLSDFLAIIFPHKFDLKFIPVVWNISPLNCDGVVLNVIVLLQIKVETK